MRRWKIWHRGDSCGVKGPVTTIDANRAERVVVVEAKHYDALRDAVAKFLAVEYPFGFSDAEPVHTADRPAYELHSALLDADGGRE